MRTPNRLAATKWLCTTAAAMATLLLSDCGLKGPLYLPSPKRVPVPAQPVPAQPVSPATPSSTPAPTTPHA